MSVTSLERLYTMRAAAETLGKSRATMYRLVNTGQVRAVRFMGSLRIPESALQRFIEAHTEEVV